MNGSMKLSQRLRVIWVIAAKDIADAIKNKITFGVILPALFVVGMYWVLPGLSRGSEPPNLLVYDAGNSSLVTALENDETFTVYDFPTQTSMFANLDNGDLPELGLVIPPHFDELLENNGQFELDGYVLHWLTSEQTDELVSLFETRANALLGERGQIEVTVNTVHTTAESRGMAFLTSVGLIVVISMMGITLTPNLMLEEKKDKTLDALLVSPAGSSEVVIAKAITGMFYTITVTGLSLALYNTLITNWPLAITAVLCGSLMAVSIGLLFGSVFEVRQQLMLWAWVVIVPLLLPAFLVIMSDLLPAWLIAAFKWIPTVALAKVFRVAYSGSAPLGDFLPGLALNLGVAVLLLALVAWVVRRADR